MFIITNFIHPDILFNFPILWIFILNPSLLTENDRLDPRPMSSFLPMTPSPRPTSQKHATVIYRQDHPYFSDEIYVSLYIVFN